VENADRRLGSKLSHRLICDMFSIYSMTLGSHCFSLVIFYWVYFILKKLFLPLRICIKCKFLFFHLKHKHLVICFTRKGIQTKALWQPPKVTRYKWFACTCSNLLLQFSMAGSSAITSKIKTAFKMYLKQNRFVWGEGDCITLRKMERIFSERFFNNVII